jgi:fluoroquinolone transport system permease protein
MYLVILSLLPPDVLQIAAPLVVFSDPTVLGLFFIGGIVMLEKLQGILMVVVITPLRSWEYLLAKVFSLALVSLMASLAIVLLTPGLEVKWSVLIISTLLSSSLFTLLGIMISAGCRTVNQYFVKMVPYMLLFILPCFSLIGFPYSKIFLLFPSVAALQLMMGAFTEFPIFETIALTLYLILINYFFFRIAVKMFDKKIVYQD